MVTHCEKLAIGEDKETNKLLDELNAEADLRAKLNTSKTREEHFNDALDEAIEFEELKAQRAEAALLTSIQARDGLISSYRSFRDVEGVTESVAVSRAVESKGNRVLYETEKAKGEFDFALQEAGIEDYYNRLRKNDSEQINVLKEIGEVNKKRGKPGVSGSRQAQQLASLYQTHINRYRSRLSKLGIAVDDLEGRMLRQVWDRDALLLHGTKQDFIRVVRDRVDKVRTFRRTDVSDAEVDDFLGKFYDDRIKGELDDVPLTQRSLVAERETFAQTQTKNRFIQLKSAEDSFFVMKEFGEDNVAAAMFNSLAGLARKTKVAEEFGINPRATVEQLKRTAKAEARPEQAARIENPPLRTNVWDGNPDQMMNIIDGSFEFSTNPKLAMTVNMLGNSVRAAFLQRVLLSSLPDLATGGRSRARIGSTVMNDVSARVDLTFQGMSPQLKRMVAGAAETANAYNIGTVSQMSSAKGVLPKFANASTIASNATMKYTGLNKWTRHNKGVAYILGSSMVARNFSKSFKNLDQLLKVTLNRGGISEAQWDSLRNIQGAKWKEGRHELLNIEAIREADEGLADGLDAALFDFVNDFVPTPGVRERAIMTQGTDAGTLQGAMMRMMTSLLGYPLTFMTRQIAREAQQGGVKGATGQLKLVAATTFMGAVGVVLQDLAKGRTRDYTTDDLDKQGAFFMEAMARGGAGGLIGGMVIDSVRFGSPATGTFSGAPASLLDDIIDGSLRTGRALTEADAEKAAAQFIKTVRPLIPLASMPQTKILIDQLMYEPLLEMTDPASLQRMRSNWRRRTGGDFIFDR